MKVKTGRFFLVYDKSSYWLYYPILGMELFLTRFSQKWFLCAHRPHTESKKCYALSWSKSKTTFTIQMGGICIVNVVSDLL